MVRIECCPVVGGSCNKPVELVSIQSNTFFLAEPFRPERQRKRREHAIRNAIKEILADQFCDSSLRIADREPKEPAVFCDICRMIQSSPYGIADISGLNPNVLLELGMMFALTRPVFVLVKKSEQENLRKKLPSDIIWKRVISYEESIDIEEELSKALKHRPEVKPQASLADEVKKIIAALDPVIAEKLEATLIKLEEEQGRVLVKLEKLLSRERLDKTSDLETGVFTTEIVDTIERTYVKGASFKGFFPKELADSWLVFEGLHYIIKKEYDKGLQTLDKAIEMAPDHTDNFLFKAVVCTELERWPEAIDCRRVILKMEGPSVGTLSDLSEVLICGGEYEKGLKMAKRALRLSKIAVDKIICVFFIICAYSFMGEKEQVKGKTLELLDYIKTLVEDQGLSVKKWEFATISRSIEKRLDEEEKKRLLSLCSLLRGEIGVKEYLKRHPS
jgi:tetratricopeptide (TPR) repeat protein